MRCIEKTLYTNGRIVTMDAAGTVAEAVLVAGNVIEAVGSKDGLAALAGPGCRTVDLKGASLYPGFIDTHSHASLYAMWKTHCRCPGIAHLEDVYPLIRKQAERVRDGDGIVVYNFDDTDIPERRGPTKRELDAVMPDRPVLVFHISGHTCYANSKALERIGVNPDAPFDDVNVFLGKDGLPNGYIAEEMAFKAMGELMPALDQERHKALVRECVAEYNAQGFTSAHDSAVGIGNLSAETVYRTYNQLYESGELNMRVYLATMEQPFRRLEPTGLLDGPGNRFVQYSAVKTLADGSIQAGTAAIPEGYFFDPSLRPGIIGLLGRDGLPLAFAGPPAFHPLQRRRGHRNHRHGGGTGAGPLPPQGRPASDHPLPDGDRRTRPAHEGGGHPALVLRAARLELGRPAPGHLPRPGSGGAP